MVKLNKYGQNYKKKFDTGNTNYTGSEMKTLRENITTSSIELH
jgi:hypothetical protein